MSGEATPSPTADAAVVVRWQDIEEDELRPGVRRRAIGNKDVMLVMNYCQPGMQLSPHSHDFEQLALILEGRAVFHVGGIRHEVSAGSAMLIPAGVEHYLEPVGKDVVVNLDVFAPAREDYLHLLDWMQHARARASSAQGSK
jgi:quercetin dioxygenase-like cupin family protein